MARVEVAQESAPRATANGAQREPAHGDCITNVVATADPVSVSPAGLCAGDARAVVVKKLADAADQVASAPTPSRRLILTSDGLTSRALEQEFHRMLGRPAEQATMWYIPTALLHAGVSEPQAVSTLRALQTQLGLGRVDMVDPERVQGEGLRSAVRSLGRVDVIWAEWGNTYALRHHLRASGGDELVRSLLDEGALYVGSSAGSIVAGRTVQTLFWKNLDDPTAGGTIDVDWVDSEVGRGLDLAGGRSLYVHARRGTLYGDREWQDAQALKHGHMDHEVVRLDDSEGFVIDGDRTFAVG